MTQIADALAVAALPSESLVQLLDILLRLARHSNDVATSIVNTPKLLASISQRFLFVSPGSEAGYHPQPFRGGLAPLRIHTSLASTLLIMTLGLYMTLASYGLCAHIASTASEPLHTLTRHVLSDVCPSDAIREAWLLLIEAWMICARNPHKTTLDYDILWSQVTGLSDGSGRAHGSPSALNSPERRDVSRILTHDHVLSKIVLAYSFSAICAIVWSEKPSAVAISTAI